jgi:hypothetical protein
MRSSPSTHRRGLLAGLLILTASVSGAVAIARGGPAPTAAAAAAAAPAANAAAPNAAAAGDDDDRGLRAVVRGDAGRRPIVARGQGDGGR